MPKTAIPYTPATKLISPIFCYGAAMLKRIGLDDESVAALHRKMSFD
jgi:hypothetical protein